MRTSGPVLTLLAVLAIGVGVFVVNTVVAKGPAASPAVQAAAQQTPQAGGSGSSDYGYGAPAAAPAAAPTQAAPTQAAAPTAPATPPFTGTYAGRSAGNEVTVAVGSDGNQVVAYVCDGKKVESWVQGTVTGASLQLTGADGELAGTTAPTAKGTAVYGTVSVGGKSWPFSAQSRPVPGSPIDRAALKQLGAA